MKTNKCKIYIIAVMMTVLLMTQTSCQENQNSFLSESSETVAIETTIEYKTITAEEAKVIMEEAENYVIIDVRSQDEFDTGYIDGAILIPHTQMQELAPDLLPDKDQIILIYCRSGNRSAFAADILTSMGYTQVYDFGGIFDWPYEVVLPN